MKIKFKSQKPKKKVDRRNQVHLVVNPDVFSELSQVELPVFMAPRWGIVLDIPLSSVLDCWGWVRGTILKYFKGML